MKISTRFSNSSFNLKRIFFLFLLIIISISEISAQCADTSPTGDCDGDLVLNKDDDDDDNDGILDADEQNVCGFTPITIPSLSSGTLTSGTSSVDFEFIQDNLSGHGPVSYNGSANGIELDHGSSGASNQSMTYTLNLNDLSANTNSRIRLSQSLFTTTGNNEASDWVITWVGGIGNA